MTNIIQKGYRTFRAPLSILISFVISLIIIAPYANANSKMANLEHIGNNFRGAIDKGNKPLSSTSNNTAQPLFKSTASAFRAECPKNVTCKVVPAVYTANNGDVEDYGNYDEANRPNDMKIDKIVIHDTEGSLSSVLAAFQNPTFYASSHYVIDKDGTVYQMVQTKDIAWHAGNWSYNMHSIGIEHIGYSKDSSSYTPAMYEASSRLVKYLANKYNIPKDREHIMGHDNVPGTNPTTAAQQHTDPGPFWNWQKYMTLIGAPVATTSHTDKLITITPNWQRNKQIITDCSSSTNSCEPISSQSTNFVPLYTEPHWNASLISDVITGQGTMEVNNTSSRVFYGQTFVVADKRYERSGIWYQIWINGQKAWLFSAWHNPTVTKTSANYATSKSSNVAVYGRPVPERSEYPSDLIASPPGSFYIPTPIPLFTIEKGQKYKLIGSAKTEHFYAWSSDSSFPYDHTIFDGETDYFEIQIGNRSGFVKKSDITIGR